MPEAVTQDVLVIGGGPAGATTATLLAEAGLRVSLLERARFPRYSVGESLIPYCQPILERLGLVREMARIGFQKKYSVQFISPDGRASQPFYFFKHLKGSAARTWQVERAKFDRLLLDNARKKGVRVLEGVTARGLIEDAGVMAGVTARWEDGREEDLRARVIVDASGRSCFTSRLMDWRVPDTALHRVAVWTYFRGARRETGLAEGATTVAYLPEKGWAWYLPLADDLVSVGVVARRAYFARHGTDPQQMFEGEVGTNPWIAAAVAEGTQEGPFRITGDYSYRARHCARDGLVLVGDALSFVDPVFSSGVYLALKGGMLLADSIAEGFRADDLSASRFVGYGEAICRDIEAMRQLVYAFYDPDFSFGKMLRKHPETRGLVTDCLIGNTELDLSPLWEAVRDFAELPEPSPHGRAMPEKRDRKSSRRLSIEGLGLGVE